MLTLLTGNRVASAAQVGGSYYLNCAGTCSAIASELEKTLRMLKLLGWFYKVWLIEAQRD